MNDCSFFFRMLVSYQKQLGYWSYENFRKTEYFPQWCNVLYCTVMYSFLSEHVQSWSLNSFCYLTRIFFVFAPLVLHEWSWLALKNCVLTVKLSDDRSKSGIFGQIFSLCVLGIIDMFWGLFDNCKIKKARSTLTTDNGTFQLKSDQYKKDSDWLLWAMHFVPCTDLLEKLVFRYIMISRTWIGCAIISHITHCLPNWI